MLPLVLILLVATALRLHALGTELWFDEILTYLRCAHRGFADIATLYDSQNQHLLYSLLARASLVGLGESGAALRVPALIFGVLSIAALYLLARDILTRTEALLAAALLAVSYHHVWFSQNARGYTAMLFFTLLATWLLLRASGTARKGAWVAYGVVCALGIYTHLTMLFVLCAHFVWYLRRIERVTLRDRGLVYGFALGALLAMLAYAPILPQLLAVNATEGRNPSHVESTAGWASRQLAMGLGVAFGHVALGVLALLLAAAGAWRLERARRGVVELFALPVAITLGVVLASGHHIWPRLLFFAIGFAALAAVAGAMAVGGAIADAISVRKRERFGLALAAVLVLASLATLPRAYEPKQRYREALALIDGARRPGDAVAAIGGAAMVFRDYYHVPWEQILTSEDLERLRARAARTWVVHTFPNRLAVSRADILAVLREQFTLVDSFEGTLKDGTVLVWRSVEGSNDVAASRRDPSRSAAARSVADP